MIRFIVALSMVVLAGCTAPKTVPYAKYSPLELDGFSSGEQLNLVITESESSLVRYKGYANYDKAGGSKVGILYPAGSPEMFAAALLAHYLTLESTKNSQKQSLQDEADNVLMPYNETIKGFYNTELLTRALLKIERENIVNNKTVSSNWVLESTPVFFMVQSGNTLMLNNLVKLYSSSGEGKALYTNLIEVASLPFEGTPSEYWNKGEKELNLTKTSIDLFAQSIEIAISDVENKLSGAETKPEQTIKYYFDGNKLYERGTLISESCERLFIRTLRGWIKSVPRADEKPEGCDDMLLSAYE